METAFTKHIGIDVPLICGAMYPCSNPELVASVSEAGGIGIIQPISLTFVHGYEFKEGLNKISQLTKKPVGMNLLIEASSKKYLERNKEWLDVALDHGVRFFVTALGDPSWFVKRAHERGAIVYHDTTNRKHAKKALDAGVDGLICVNNRAGGHAGPTSPEKLYEELHDLGVPLICAGGIGDASTFKRTIDIGYAGVQMGTRFIASQECTAHDDYKQAIIGAKADDVVLTERITGVPVAVIKTKYIEKVGTEPPAFMKWMLKHPKMKHWARTALSVKSFFDLKSALKRPQGHKDFWQAGKSVEEINGIEPAGTIVKNFAAALTS